MLCAYRDSFEAMRFGSALRRAALVAYVDFALQTSEAAAQIKVHGA